MGWDGMGWMRVGAEIFWGRDDCIYLYVYTGCTHLYKKRERERDTHVYIYIHSFSYNNHAAPKTTTAPAAISTKRMPPLLTPSLDTLL